MEWSTVLSIEKVICFIQERLFLFDVSSAELAKKFDARNLRKFLDCVSPPLVMFFSLSYFCCLSLGRRGLNKNSLYLRPVAGHCTAVTGLAQSVLWYASL